MISSKNVKRTLNRAPYAGTAAVYAANNSGSAAAATAARSNVRCALSSCRRIHSPAAAARAKTTKIAAARGSWLAVRNFPAQAH